MTGSTRMTGSNQERSASGGEGLGKGGKVWESMGTIGMLRYSRMMGSNQERSGRAGVGWGTYGKV